MTDPLPASIRDLLVRKEVLGYEALRKLVPRMLNGVPGRPAGGENDFTDVSMKNVAYTAGRLYALDHPDNPYAGDAEALGTCLRLVDAWCEAYEAARAAGRPMDTNEWPPYIMAQLVGMLGGSSIGSERLARWKANLAEWCAIMAPKPFGFTSPNHEAWKCLCLHAAAEVLGRPDYAGAAVWQQRQELHYQTPDGFWEEGRHHGPSLKYCFMQLHAMARLAKMSGDAGILAAAVRLADFMAEFTFPDGTTMGCLDGRQSYALGPWLAVVPGQELTPAMREVTRRSVATQHRWGCFKEPRYLSTSYWYMTYGMVMLTDGSRFFEEVIEPRTAHPLDAGGAVVERHSCHMDGGAIRRGGFVCALSGVISDIPASGGRFRLQRQNRLDLWHERTGLILGGGHGPNKQNPPLANVIVDTGHAGRTEFGLLDAGRWQEQQSYFSPRAARTSFAGGEARLDLHFAHASVLWRVSFPEADVAEIGYRFRTLGAERLGIQVVPVFWRDCSFSVDGERVDPYEPAVLPVRRSVEVTNSRLGGTYSIEIIGGGGEARLRTPIEPLRTYGELYEDEAFDTVWKQSLLSIRLDDPPREGGGLLRVTVR